MDGVVDDISSYLFMTFPFSPDRVVQLAPGLSFSALI